MPAEPPSKASVVLRRTSSAGHTVIRTETPLPNPPTSAATPGATSLEAYRAALGTVADHVIAERAGVDRAVVGAYRRSLGVAAYAGYRWGPGQTAPRRTGTTGTSPAPAAVAKARSGSAIDAYLDLLGTTTDGAIAAMAGVSRDTVKQYRRQRGIGRYVAPVNPERASAPTVSAPIEPEPIAVAAPTPAVAPVAVDAAVVMIPERAQSATPNEIKRLPGRQSKIDPFSNIVGIEQDHVVAALAGSTAKKVATWRERRGIPAPVVVVGQHAVSGVEHAVEVVAAPLSAPVVEPAVEAVVAAPVAPVLSDLAEIEDTPLARVATPRSEPVSAKLLPFVHLLGVETDRAIGKRAGIPLWSVRAWRVRKGIPAAPLGARARAERVWADAQPAVVEPPVAPREIERVLVSDVGEIEPVDASAPDYDDEPDVPSRMAYKVHAVSGERTWDFIVVADDIGEAAVNASDALGRRRDGPWRVTRMRELLEAVE